MTRIVTTLMFLMLALSLPATASAQRPATLAPPGNSAVSQYLETVPTDRGGGVARPLGGHGGAGTGGEQGAGALSPGARQALEGLGSDGRALAAIVDATSSPASGHSRGTSAHGRGGSGQAAGPGSGSAPSAQALSGAGGPSPASLMLSAAIGRGGGGFGFILPALILAALLGVGLRVFLGRRRPEL